MIHDMIWIWYDMIWYDMIWYDMILIWYDMIWYDMIWYDDNKCCRCGNRWAGQPVLSSGTLFHATQIRNDFKWNVKETTDKTMHNDITLNISQI